MDSVGEETLEDVALLSGALALDSPPPARALSERSSPSVRWNVSRVVSTPSDQAARSMRAAASK